MRKLMKPLFTAFLIINLLVACNPQTVTPQITPGSVQTKTVLPLAQETPVPTPAPEISVDELKLKGLQIQFLHPWTGDTAAVMAQMVDQFNQTNEWGIHVIAIAPGSAGLATQKFYEGIKDGHPVDLFAASTSLLLLADESFENIIDLNSFVSSAKYGLGQAAIDDFLPSFWKEDSVNGKRLGVPAQRTAGVMFYNLTWGTELGITAPPESTADFQKAVCAANASMKKDSVSTNDGLGGWITNADAITMLSWLRSFKETNASTPVDSFDTDSSTEALTYLLQLLKSSCAWNSRLAQPYDYFTSRQTLAYSGTLQDIMVQVSAYDRSGSQEDWTVLPYPADNAKKLVTDGLSYGVLKSDPERQLAAWLFIRWLSSAQNQARILRTSGTLPLGSAVVGLMDDFKSTYPQWGAAIELLKFVEPDTPQSNGEIITYPNRRHGRRTHRAQSMNLPEVVIYTDGGCDPNPGAGGWAALIIINGKSTELSGFEPQSTNNRMELTAAIHALTSLAEPSRVTLYTDSQYLQRGIDEWMPKWVEKNWRGSNGPVLNQDLWQALLTSAKPHQITWRWLKGHSGNRFNTRVDALVKQARQSQKTG
jgi:ribonuclease HI/ABC-type glycerol-3-phosphate transport system substrate-binding protein